MRTSIDRYADSKIYRVYFSNLTDLYYYLKSNPEVNDIFFVEQASMHNEDGFYGESLEKAIEYCKGGYEEKHTDFSKFLGISSDMRKVVGTGSNDRKLERGLYGGVALPSLVASGVPACMLRYSYDKSVKHVTIYFQLSYPAGTEYRQIFNRGIATINLINALEANNYIVDLKTFELSEYCDEFIDISITLKTPTEKINISKCYYPFVSKEFLRRILFRVLESMPVNYTGWSIGYGSTSSSSQIKKIYNLKDSDIIIPKPSEIGIEGWNIYEDTITLIKYLNLQDEIDLTKLEESLKNSDKSSNYQKTMSRGFYN